MTDNKDEQKDKKNETESTEKENQEDVQRLKSESATFEEYDKRYKSENLGELLKGLPKDRNVTINIGNVFGGETHLRDAFGHGQAKHTKRRSKKVPPKDGTDKADKWLDENQLVEDRILLLSVAVFNGATLEIIIDAQKRLQELIFENESERKPKSGIFESSISKRLLGIGASIKEGLEDTQYGRVKTRIVELNDDSLPSTIIKHYWEEYKFDAFHEIVIRWLREAADDTPFQMRVRAAIVVGELLKSDFRPIEADILSKWATSPNPTTRTSAAIAINIPAFDNEWAPQVLKLLHYWSTVNNWRLCWTATAAYAAYAGPIGLKFPDEALKDLRYIAKTGDLRLIGVLTQSIRSLFDEGETNENLYKKILDSLIDWTEKPKEAQGTVGLFVFLNLARIARIKADPEGDDWYTLLWLLQKRDKYPSNQIVSLWRRALNLKQSRMEAIKILQSWVKSVDADARLYDALEWLITEIVDKGESREGDRLRFYLQKMEESPSADKLLRNI